MTFTNPPHYHRTMSDWQTTLMNLCSLYFETSVVSPMEFYQDVFPREFLTPHVSYPLKDKPLPGHKGNPLILIEQSKYLFPDETLPPWCKDADISVDGNRITRLSKRILFDDYKMVDDWKKLMDVKHVFCGGLNYIGKKRRLDNAVSMSALIFDLDLEKAEGLKNFMYGCTTGIYPTPNYVVLSGRGVHLYYVFEEPIPLYHGSYGRKVKKQVAELKKELTQKIWNPYTIGSETEGLKPQYQSINQAFRMVGSYTKSIGTVEKHRYPVVAVKLTGVKKYETLSSFYDYVSIPEKLHYKGTSVRGLEFWKKVNPEWYERRIIQGDKSIRYYTMNKALYDWFLRKILQGATYGHRYHCMVALAVYAIKCDVPIEEVKQDLKNLLPFFEKIKPDDPITEDDIKSALQSYQVEMKTFPVNSIIHLTKINLREQEVDENGKTKERTRRNGRKQAEHLKGARALQEIYNPNWREGNGRKPQQEKVQKWREANPTGKKADCIKETGLSKPTVYKWW